MGRVTREFGAYNPRRYGRPWIAKVIDWPVGKPPSLEFGTTVGAHLVEIDTKPGAVVRWGQRDHRGGNTEAAWGIVQSDFSIVEYGDPEFCRKHWLAGCPVPKPESNETPEECVDNLLDHPTEEDQ